MVGLARSGKSTIANKWLQRQINIRNGTINHDLDSGHFIPRIVVNADQIRLTLHGKPFDYKLEGKVEELEDFIIRLYLNSGYDVLVDETHTSNRRLLHVLRLDPQADFYIVDTPVEECERRALACNQPWLVEHQVIRRMHNNLDKWKHDPITHINKLRKQVLKNG